NGAMVFRPTGFAVRGWPKPFIFATVALHERVTRSQELESSLSRQARVVFAHETVRESGGRSEVHASSGGNAGAGRRERSQQNDTEPRYWAPSSAGCGRPLVRKRPHHRASSRASSLA